MLKKCLIAIAVVALLATTVQAVDPIIKKDAWPWTYDELDICTIPVYMDVGHYVQIEKCNELKIELKQTDCSVLNYPYGGFPCYGNGVDGPACTTFKARANFAAIFGATLATSGDGITNIYGTHFPPYYRAYGLSWPLGNTITGATGGWEELKLCMEVYGAQLFKAGAGTAGTTILVGRITIDVKPPHP
jgi:hypothetical protein